MEAAVEKKVERARGIASRIACGRGGLVWCTPRRKPRARAGGAREVASGDWGIKQNR